MRVPRFRPPLYPRDFVRIGADSDFVFPASDFRRGSSVFVADFNGDGKPDLLTSDGTMNLGNGDGTFKVGTPVGLVAVDAVADFNGDGKPDLLVEEGINTYIVLLGNGDGTFQSPISTAIKVAFLPAVADLNGDDQADVVEVYSGALYVFISNGDGTFKPGVAYSLGAPEPGECFIADFNGDGKPDVVVNAYGQELVFLGNGDGRFRRKRLLRAFPTDGPPLLGPQWRRKTRPRCRRQLPTLHLVRSIWEWRW